MQYAKVDEFDVVTRIAGPLHHDLGLVISEELDPPTLVAEIMTLGGSGARIESNVQGNLFCVAVLRGISTANQRLGTRYGISKVRLVASDPPIPAIYESLAENLVEHLAAERFRFEPGCRGSFPIESR